MNNPNASYVRIPSLKIEGEASTEFFPIVLRYTDTVVILVSYHYQDLLDPSTVTQFDEDGNGLAHISNDNVVAWLEDDEMDDIMGMIDADERLLSYAH